MSENITSSQVADDFKSFLNEIAATAFAYGRASLPIENIERTTTLMSSISMEATQPCLSPRNEFEEDIHSDVYTAIEGTFSLPVEHLSPAPSKTYVVSDASLASEVEPVTPKQIFYGPCPHRHLHSSYRCSTCKLTETEYRLERLQQSRAYYSMISRDYAKSKASHAAIQRNAPLVSSSQKRGICVNRDPRASMGNSTQNNHNRLASIKGSSKMHGRYSMFHGSSDKENSLVHRQPRRLSLMANITMVQRTPSVLSFKELVTPPYRRRQTMGAPSTISSRSVYSKRLSYQIPEESDHDEDEVDITQDELDETQSTDTSEND